MVGDGSVHRAAVSNGEFDSSGTNGLGEQEPDMDKGVGSRLAGVFDCDDVDDDGDESSNERRSRQLYAFPYDKFDGSVAPNARSETDSDTDELNVDEYSCLSIGR